jgi:hypothetical protein
MSRQHHLDKISELISDPSTCKIGLELMRQFDLTPQEMCRVILASTLSNIERLFLAAYILEVETLLFVDAASSPDAVIIAQVSGDKREELISEARWKELWKINFHDDADYYRQKQYLEKIGAI